MSDSESDRDSIIDEKLDSEDNMDTEMDSQSNDSDHENSEKESEQEEQDSEENMDTDMDSADFDFEDSEQSGVEEELDPVDELKDLLNAMSAQTKKATESMLSKDEEIREHCTSLRVKVDAQTEAMMEEIRQWNVETRDRINKYEKECLDKFNSEQFEASASVMKSLLAEITEHQNRIEQQIKDANLDTEKVNEMIEETSAKIQELELENLKLSKQKFGDLMLDVVIDEKKTIDPRASLIKSTVFGLESMQYISTIRDMPGFKRLSYCFINPFAASHELIAIVEKSKNQNVLVKMDASGKILQEKPCCKFDARYGIRYLQTVKDCFILQDSEGQYKRFDYDLNELQTKRVNTDYIDSGFAANQRHLFNPHIEEDYYRGRGPRHICINNHNLSGDPDGLSYECDVDSIGQMLASDKYLYIWHHRERVEVVQLDYNRQTERDKQTDHNEEIYVDSKLVVDKCFDLDSSDSVKLFGDEYIAAHNKENATVCLYTQDDKLDFVKEYEIRLDEEFKMSCDASNGFCFFHPCGEIYHTLF